jgi:hypothetical protein
MADVLDQQTRSFKTYGGAVYPVLPTRFGQSQNQATSATAGAQIDLTSKMGNCDRIIRIHAIAAPIYFVMGLTGLAAPGVGDGYVPQDQYLETIAYINLPFIRFIAVSGTGTARVEILG